MWNTARVKLVLPEATDRMLDGCLLDAARGQRIELKVRSKGMPDPSWCPLMIPGGQLAEGHPSSKPRQPPGTEGSEGGQEQREAIGGGRQLLDEGLFGDLARPGRQPRIGQCAANVGRKRDTFSEGHGERPVRGGRPRTK